MSTRMMRFVPHRILRAKFKMARLEPTKPTIRLLFARSGNQCAFPGCTHELINSKNQFVAHICHIKAAERGGPRFDPAQNDEQRRDPSNLILLCYRHHVETDDEEEFPADQLSKIKHRHEAGFSTDSFSISEALVAQIEAENSKYWKHIHVLNNEAHSIPELSLFIDVNASAPEICEKLGAAFTSLEGFIGHLCEALHGSREHWETINLAVPNWSQSVRVLLIQLEVKIAEQQLCKSPDDLALRGRLHELRSRFEEVAQHAAHID